MGLSSSCSGPEVKTVPKKLASAKKEPLPAAKSSPVVCGPTNPHKVGGYVDVAAKLGLEKVKSTHNYIVDWNGDGIEDLVILPEYYGSAEFYLYNKKRKKFTKVNYNPFGEVTRSSFMAFADFNRDGLRDVVLATLNQKTELNKDPLRLYYAKKVGKRIKYTLAPSAFPNTIYPVSSLGISDFNMDGVLDIYVGNWYDFQKGGNKSAPDRIFFGEIKEKKLHFVDHSADLGAEHKFDSDLNIFPNATPTFGTSVCDLDQNGFPDILTASSGGYSNHLWLNRKDKVKDSKARVFMEYGVKAKLAHDNEGAYSPLGGGNSFYAICQDYNNDGAVDVAVGELFHSYDTESRDRSAILTSTSRNFPPKFLRTEYHMDDGTGSWNQGDRRAVWIDYNFDSYTDLIVENSGFPPKSRLVAFDQDASHAFADLAKDLGIDIVNPSGVVSADFNQDGKPDLIVGQVSIRNAEIKPRLYAFENQLPWHGKRVLKIILKGKKANVHGLGATVFVFTNRGSYMKNMSLVDGGLPSQNGEGLYFGLAPGEKVMSIEVRWPFLKKDRSGRLYPYRKTYKVSDHFKHFKQMTLSDF